MGPASLMGGETPPSSSAASQCHGGGPNGKGHGQKPRNRGISRKQDTGLVLRA